MNGTALMARPRTTLSKGKTKGLRKNGFIPAILYGKGMENKAIAVEAREVECILSAHQGGHPVVTLSVPGEPEMICIMQEIQRDPMTNEIRHIDFYRLDLHRKITTTIPILLVGRPEGEKTGGVLQHGLREVEVECLPKDLPESVTVDISHLQVGDHITVADMTAPPGVVIKTQPHELICTINATRTEGEEEAAKAPAAPTPEIKEHTA